ncbi:hypothetical protein Pedsa_3568 [Pseudopedobacter saltans DSM 12145]|uniref:Uncharacterized protein n=1 Tax=Pseudopedobacter saltans (strain ATCC 51119 / DSM 12145 / JCM 21818 / CCUG 39354 / LMG 10337 / NBRC 100064 / NCIMB 13643) TaxID=762903 RepID=F0SF29_PSESL|nr:hypothetical protein [Pseudopedobacter saltans]ADY54097.1 hypothetical protein Pedsa_3568 [Pseudopedobacter saltans DSM 12145]
MKSKLLIRIGTMLIALVASMQFVNAQIYASSQADPFQFSNGATEWSDPVSFTLTSKKFKDKGLEAVPLEFRIKVKKKLLLACHFTVEVKNLSDKQGIYFEARNDYTDATNKYIYHKVKLKPGATQTFDIIYADLKCKIKSKEDCPNCGWNFTYVEVKPY